jgi:hypothetical protein
LWWSNAAVGGRVVDGQPQFENTTTDQRAAVSCGYLHVHETLQLNSDSFTTKEATANVLEELILNSSSSYWPHYCIWTADI